MPGSIVYFPLKWSCHMKHYIDIKHVHDVFRAVELLLFAKHRKCYGIPLNKCWLVFFKPLSKISIRIWFILAMRGEFQWGFLLCMLNLVSLNPCIDSYLALLRSLWNFLPACFAMLTSCLNIYLFFQEILHWETLYSIIVSFAILK